MKKKIPVTSSFLLFLVLDFFCRIYPCIMRTPILKPVFRKKSVSMSFLTKKNFLDKFSRNVKSSCTCAKISYRSCCKSFNVLSVQWYIKFYDVFFVGFCCFVAARSNATICTTHFYERGVLELDLLATWTRFKMALRRIFSRSFLFQIFPHLFKKPKDKWVDHTFTRPKALLCHRNTRENATDFQSWS